MIVLLLLLLVRVCLFGVVVVYYKEWQSKMILEEEWNRHRKRCLATSANRGGDSSYLLALSSVVLWAGVNKSRVKEGASILFLMESNEALHTR
jgi:hypothetical protein